jgi:ribose 5-phosphate isomerase B
MRVLIGCDHRGAEAATGLRDALRHAGHTAEIAGACDAAKSCDYPDAAWAVGSAVAKGEADRGILICGTGIGMSIAANKVAGVRAAVVHDELTAELSRAHNDANVLCMSGDMLGRRLIENIALVWLKTDFEGGRHERRVKKIGCMERGVSPGECAEAQG